jgi:bifunctional ADP-heptose synthase (sugar kinase/adenylyltransferase)
MYGKVERLEPSAPVPVIKINDIVKNPGMAMNVAKNIGSLNMPYDIVTNSNWKNITKTRIVEENINHMFLRVDEETGYTKFNKKTVDFALYSAVIISDYDKGFLSKEDIIHICNSHHLVFLDTKKPIGDWCKCATYVKINDAEYKNAEKITDILKQKLIITLGNKGACHLDKIYSVDKTEVKDVSGAGDTFLAGLVVEYMRSNSIEKSIKFANKCATKVVQKKGISAVLFKDC